MSLGCRLGRSFRDHRRGRCWQRRAEVEVSQQGRHPRYMRSRATVSVTSPHAAAPIRFRVCKLSPQTTSGMYSTQDASSQPEVGRREEKNTAGCFPTCPQSLLERRLVVSKSHSSRDYSDAPPKCSCKRRRKGRLVKISQRGGRFIVIGTH